MSEEKDKEKADSSKKKNESWRGQKKGGDRATSNKGGPPKIKGKIEELGFNIYIVG